MKPKRIVDKNGLYSIILGSIILLDSIVTLQIGTEKNPILLKIMEILNLSLGSMMLWRTIVLWAAVYFLYKNSIKIKNIIFCYVLLYGILIITL
jgi:hypothetical protein